MDTENEDTYREQIPTKTWIDFWITDFPMKHEELTELLGIQPTEAENKGDEFYNRSKKKIDYLAHNKWKLSSNIGDEKYIPEHVNHMFNIIHSKKAILQPLLNSIEPAYLNITLHIDHKFREYFEIEPRILKELGEMNILVSVDIYSVDENGFI